MDMYKKEDEAKVVLCGASAYEKKYYFNEQFKGLPDSIKEELHIICVLFTEEVGGILSLSFEDEGDLYLTPMCDEGDLLYDEIGCGLKIKEIQRTKEELLESLELYYKAVILGQGLGAIEKEEE